METIIAESLEGLTHGGDRSPLPGQRTVAILAAQEDVFSLPRALDAFRAHLPELSVMFRSRSGTVVTVSAADPLPDLSGQRPPEDPLPASGAWVAEADLVYVPNATPSLLPALSVAMLRGIPVVGIETPLARQVIGTGGILVRPSEDPAVAVAYIQRLLNDSEEARKVGNNGRGQVRALLGQLPVFNNGRIVRQGQWIVPDDTETERPGSLRTGVSVIIPTTGGARVARCIRALRKAAADTSLQIICVVTGGLAGALPPCDDVVRCEPPFVWAKANNAGLRVARHELVLVLNDDCYFQRKGDLDRLVRRLQTCGHLVAVAPCGTGFPPQWCQSTLPAGSGLRESHYTLCGACFLVRREAFCAVGLFDERFETYGCDEVDWFYRARAVGYRWGVDANVRVEHEWSSTFGERKRQEWSQSFSLFRSIHGVPPDDGSHWEPPRREVSWVIASHNNAGHLARCLGSIAAQRHLYPPSMEVVLAFDGCTDASISVAEAVNASFDLPLPLRVISFRDPAGCAARAKNRALRLALGDVHLPMDDDDATTPGRARLVAELADGADVTVGNFWHVQLDGTIQLRRPGPFHLRGLLGPGAQGWGPWATAIRRETWSRFGLHREDLNSNEDFDLWLRWMRDGAKFRYVDVTAHLYMLRPGSVVFAHQITRVRESIASAYRAGKGAPKTGLQVSSRRT